MKTVDAAQLEPNGPPQRVLDLLLDGPQQRGRVWLCSVLFRVRVRRAQAHLQAQRELFQPRRDQLCHGDTLGGIGSHVGRDRTRQRP